MVKKIAGESFSAITGLTISGALESSDEPQVPDIEVGPDDAPPIVRPEDDLPRPNVEAVKQWWGKESARFRPGTRFIYGQQRKSENLKASLRTAPTWRREILMLELASSTEDAPKVELKGWARDQLLLLG
jgi:hypothetical protein